MRKSLEENLNKFCPEGITRMELTTRAAALSKAIASIAEENKYRDIDAKQLSIDVFNLIATEETDKKAETKTRALKLVRSFVSNSQDEIELIYEIIKRAHQHYTYMKVSNMLLAPANYYQAASAEFAPWARIAPNAAIFYAYFLDRDIAEESFTRLEVLHQTKSTSILKEKGVIDYTSLQRAIHDDFWKRFDEEEELSDYHPGPQNFIFNMSRSLYFKYVCYMIALELVHRGLLPSKELPEKPASPESTCPWNYDCTNCGSCG